MTSFRLKLTVPTVLHSYVHFTPVLLPRGRPGGGTVG
jgi:hypothetical protein